MDIFSGTRGPHNAPILIVGEAYGEYERVKGVPFMGPSGNELESMLSSAGINPSDCLMTNVVNQKAPANDMTHFLFKGRNHVETRGLYPGTPILDGLRSLYALIRQTKPKAIIAAGDWPLWALTPMAVPQTKQGFSVPTGLSKWRGSQLYLDLPPFLDMPTAPLLPIHHPVKVLRDQEKKAITIHDLGRVKVLMDQNFNPYYWDPRTVCYTVGEECSQILLYLNGLLAMADEGPLKLSVDLETTPNALIRTIAIAHCADAAICIPFLRSTQFGYENYFGPEDFTDICLRLRTLLLHDNVEIIGQNFSYDLAYLTRYLACCPKVHMDTMLAHHLLFPGTPKSLDMLASLYCSHYVYWKDDLKDSNEASDDYGAFIYNCEDAARTYEIATVLGEQIQLAGMEEQWRFQRKYFWTCFQKSTKGILYDRKARFEKKMKLMNQVEEMRAFFHDVMPTELTNPKAKAPWFDSPTQFTKILYTYLGFTPILNRQTKQPTTNDEALMMLIEQNGFMTPIFKALQLYRSACVFLNNILSAKAEPDHRLTSSFNPGGTETFRLSSSQTPLRVGLNLQNIARNPEE